MKGTACQHTPRDVSIRDEVDSRCEACRDPMKVGASYHRFADPVAQFVHDKEAKR